MSSVKKVSSVLPLRPAATTPAKAPAYRKCYEGHPPLTIGDFVIYGGSCSSPVVSDADVYVGFDYGHAKTPQSYPWMPGDSFYFPITDMHAPSDFAQFKNLLTYLSVQLTAQKKVHIGCIGGHGRTGTVLAALVATMTGELDAINYVRKHYCEKAVESKAQVDFLVKNFGITSAPAAKEIHPPRVHGSTSDYGGMKSYNRSLDLVRSIPSLPAGTAVVTPVQSVSSIWGQNVSFDKSG